MIMIWLLLFALVFGSSNNNEFMIPSYKKYVKESVVNKNDRKAIDIILDSAKVIRKPFIKTVEKQRKEIDQLFKTQTTTKDQFDSLNAEYINVKANVIITNLKTLRQTQDYISKEEWEMVSKKIADDVIAFRKEAKKKLHVATKFFSSINKKIEGQIADEQKKNLIIDQMIYFEKLLVNRYQNVIEIAVNDNSLIYKYQYSQQTINDTQDEINKEMSIVLEEYAKLHFVIKENTTATEWKKVINNLTLPY